MSRSQSRAAELVKELLDYFTEVSMNLSTHPCTRFRSQIGRRISVDVSADRELSVGIADIIATCTNSVQASPGIQRAHLS